MTLQILIYLAVSITSGCIIGWGVETMLRRRAEKKRLRERFERIQREMQRRIDQESRRYWGGNT